VLKSECWQKCVIYLDDVLVYSTTFSDHIERLRTIFERIRNAGIKLSLQKCSFFNKQIRFLGHIISKDGVSTDPDKIRAVKQWPTPKTLEQLRSFLGFSNYYRRFIHNYTELVSPLEKLLNTSSLGSTQQKKAMILWTTECEMTFEKIKTALCSSKTLAYPLKDSTFVLDTDASHCAMGAVLSQNQNGVERVIAYASKKFTKSELNYCVTRKELLSVYTFVMHFRHYLLGSKFRIRTDHKALVWLLNWEKPNTSQY
jgi:hypothetical protein